jgi:ParB family transcriptional regulator, chromosome partitioning protein
MKRNALGKGIAAIISNQPLDLNKLLDLPVENIYPNPFQPRKNFRIEKIRELAESMRTSGIIQPVVVYKKEGRYYLVVGERRWRAAQTLKWEKIPAIVREIPEENIASDSLIENIQREELNAIEIAEGIEALGKSSGYNQQMVADKLGMGRTTVTNFLRLLKLPKSVQKSIINGEIDQGHGRALLSLPTDEQISEVSSLVIKKKLSVRQTEKLVHNCLRKKKLDIRTVDPDLQKIENRLTKLLSTRVKLSYKPSGKGKIEIFFPSLAEFDRIFKLVNGE